jgi:hypothetical protein
MPQQIVESRGTALIVLLTVFGALCAILAAVWM